jgi:hypothetical protein
MLVGFQCSGRRPGGAGRQQFNDQRILRAAGVKEDFVRRTSNLIESYSASSEKLNMAVRMQNTDVEFAIYDFDIENPCPEDLEWQRDDDPDTAFVIWD